MEKETDAGFQIAKRYAETMIALYDTGKQKDDKDWAKNEIQEQLINGLTPPINASSANQPSSA